MEPTVGVSFKTIKVTVRPEHFRDAPHGYRIGLKALRLGGGNEDTWCVLKCALVDQLGLHRVGTIGAHFAYIGRSMYSVPETWGRTSGEWSSSEINKWSERAKESLEGIPTTEVILTLYKKNCEQSQVI